jgi:hypothetical protein
METTSVTEFGWLARQLSMAARACGLKAPGFRSPPRVAGRTRTVRHYTGGNYLVSVQTKNRDRHEVIADMVEGIVVTNKLDGDVADAARRRLLQVVTQESSPNAA